MAVEHATGHSFWGRIRLPISRRASVGDPSFDGEGREGPGACTQIRRCRAARTAKMIASAASWQEIALETAGVTPERVRRWPT